MQLCILPSDQLCISCTEFRDKKIPTPRQVRRELLLAPTPHAPREVSCSAGALGCSSLILGSRCCTSEFLMKDLCLTPQRKTDKAALQAFYTLFLAPRQHPPCPAMESGRPTPPRKLPSSRHETLPPVTRVRVCRSERLRKSEWIGTDQALVVCITQDWNPRQDSSL